MPEYLNSKEVAQMLRVEPETVRYWRQSRSGNIGPRHFKINGRVLYARADVEQFIAEAMEATG